MTHGCVLLLSNMVLRDDRDPEPDLRRSGWISGPYLATTTLIWVTREGRFKIFAQVSTAPDGRCDEPRMNAASDSVHARTG